jgi:hypothetical protein
VANKQSLQDKLAALAEATRRTDSTAFLVEARVIRRLIREQFAFPRLFTKVPHARVYVASYEELRREVHVDELGLTDPSQLPPHAILIQEPTERQLERLSDEQLRLRTWRLLFHGKLDAAIRAAVDDGTLSAPEIRRRIDELGQVTFDEIHTVLRRESLLMDTDSPNAAWLEFAAVYLEFRFFAPGSIQTWFPSLRDRDLPTPLPEINADALFAGSRVDGSAEPAGVIDAEAEDVDAESKLDIKGRTRPSARRHKRLLRLADRASVGGNTVLAAILAARSMTCAPDDQAQAANAAAFAEIDRLIDRLRAALDFDDVEAAHWRAALTRILPHAISGFWNHDRKLLYDLQKVCSDHERVTYKVDLVKWVVSRGKRPIKRPLPNQSEAMMAKHLRTAAGRLPFIHLSGLHRERLSTLIRSAAASAEQQMRQRLRPVVRTTLAEVGFEPRNLPERVAFNKVTEQSLDCIADRGYLTMGYLRDAISRNNLKLPDVSSIGQIIKGDRLLKADDKFDVALDGVYHRGEFYLRWLQVISSLAFGTRAGRFATQYIAIPFGGAFLIVEGINHLLHRIVTRDSSGPWELPIAVLLLGFFLMALIHLRAFREAVISVSKQVLKGARWAFIELPSRMLNWKKIREFLRTRPVRLVNRYIVTPGILVCIGCYAVPRLLGLDFPRIEVSGTLFVLISLFLNSRIGRDLEELSFDWVSTRWYQLRAHVFVALFDWIWEAFEKVLEVIERFLYAIDEWLRFRSGESVFTLGVKAVLGVVWSLVDFVIRFCVNLLIEPQVNPIKHFPVVTVSHKLLLPTVPVVLGPILVRVLGSEAAAQTAAVTIATAIPGVFGFLVWELKENWRLYEANHSDKLKPVAVGSHGETMLRLLKPGFHSGTLPKLYHKLRRLDRKAASFRRSVRRQALYEQLHHCEEAIRHHVERELFAYLELTGEWKDELLWVDHVDATSNSVGIAVEWEAAEGNPLRLVFQEQSGWLLAGVQDPGWTATLDGARRDSFLAALFGFYKVGAVDMSREQIRHSLADAELAYDISDVGLKVWPGEGFKMEFIYDLERSPLLTPKPASAGRRIGLPAIKSDELILSESPLRWHRWIRFWSDEEAARDSEDLLDGRVLVTELNGTHRSS